MGAMINATGMANSPAAIWKICDQQHKAKEKEHTSRVLVNYFAA